MLIRSTKRLVAAAKCLVVATKNLFVVPNFVAVTKPFFSVLLVWLMEYFRASKQRISLAYGLTER